MKSYQKSPLVKRIKIYLWSIGLTFIAINVFFAIQTATLGGEMNSYENEAKKLMDENVNLKDVLVKKISLSNLKEGEDFEGFVTAKVTYIKIDKESESIGQRR